jgi:glycosyltransferase involved in cell wall biosynthesis
MIVKDEAAVIRRCLQSVRPMIDTWCIVDTGSTDNTRDIIREVFHDLPGILVERPWVDFAHNRTESLELARRLADYSFIMDADDVVEAPFVFTLTADAYTVLLKNSGTTYRRVQMVSNRLPWRYRGVLHEFLDCSPWTPVHGDLPIAILCGHDSARARDPSTYARDAEILEAAISEESDPFLRSRYGFYLAQSYRDCGEQGKALFWYLWRSDQGFWDEEVYVSLLNAARIAEGPETSLETANAVDLYQRAIATVPTRAEAYHGLAHLFRARDDFELGFLTAKMAVELAPPSSGLFVEQWIYEWGVLDEIAISGYWCGRYREALDASELILSEGRCTDMDRIKANANFSRRKLLAS